MTQYTPPTPNDGCQWRQLADVLPALEPCDEEPRSQHGRGRLLRDSERIAQRLLGQYGWNPHDDATAARLALAAIEKAGSRASKYRTEGKFCEPTALVFKIVRGLCIDYVRLHRGHRRKHARKQTSFTDLEFTEQHAVAFSNAAAVDAVFSCENDVRELLTHPILKPFERLLGGINDCGWLDPGAVDAVMGWIVALDDLDREILKLRGVEGHSARATAKIIGIRVRRVHYVFRKIRQSLEQLLRPFRK